MMMIFKKQSLLICLLAFTACSSPLPSSYSVSGTLRDSSFDGKTIYIYHYDSRKNIDSTIIKGKKFVFTGKADTAIFCRIEIKREYGNFILENGAIEVDMLKHNRSTGTPLNDSLTKLFLTQDSINQKMNLKRIELKKQYTDETILWEKLKDYFQNELKPTYIAVLKGIYETNSNNDVGLATIQEIQNYTTPDEIETMMEKAGELLKSRSLFKKFAQKAAACKNTAEGKPFVNFTAEKENGDPVSISNYVGKGKYVLVDFWASWCQPCLEEMPTIAEVYKQYKNKGLEVVSVAMWDKPEASRKAIKELGNTWPQMLNAQMKPFELYGFDGIPFIILFAPDGTIAARNLRGESLKQKVKEVMENNN